VTHGYGITKIPWIYGSGTRTGKKEMKNLVTLLLLTTTSAYADGRKITDVAISESNSAIHVFNYSEFDKQCRSWTDGCRNCFNDEKRKGCSNIGIVCSPSQTIRCLDRSEEK
jgi:hypothetical protein